MWGYFSHQALLIPSYSSLLSNFRDDDTGKTDRLTYVGIVRLFDAVRSCVLRCCHFERSREIFLADGSTMRA